jgi:hypothetical protein
LKKAYNDGVHNSGNSPRNIDNLLKESHYYSDNHPEPDGELITLYSEEEHDVYNPTSPFEYEGTRLVAGRSEPRAKQLDSKIKFFRYIDETLTGIHEPNLPTLPLQDPSVARLQDTWVVSGVRTYPKPNDEQEAEYWETEFYIGNRFNNLKLHAVGPKNMKDIRLVEMDEEIGVFTRPQGEKGGRGKIGFIAIKHLDQLAPDLLYDAPLIDGVIADQNCEWGGVNEARYLGDGKFGVAAHLARFVMAADGLSKQYFGMTFVYDTENRTISKEQIVACRKCFPPATTKRQGLEHVYFLNGIEVREDSATIYGGLSDATSGRKHIPHPFL